MRLVIVTVCLFLSLPFIAQEKIIAWDNGNLSKTNTTPDITEYDFKYNRGADKVKLLAKRGTLRRASNSKIYYSTSQKQTGQQLIKVNMIQEHENVSLALSDFSYIYSDSGDENHTHKLQIEGLRLDGSIVYPVFAKNEFLNGQFQIIDEGKLEFTGGTSHDCIIQFNEPVKNIIVKVLGAQTIGESNLSFSLSDIAFNDSPIDDNFSFAPINCSDIKVLFLLDASNSIEASQHVSIEQKLFTNLRRLKNRTDINVQAAFAEFDNGANLALDYTPVTDVNTANTGPIGNYLKNIYNSQQNGSAQFGEMTNWEAGFRKSWNQISEIPDLVVFITDGLPNWSNSSTQYPKNSQGAIHLVKQFKQSGTHVLCIGIDMIDEESPNPWFNKITNEDNPVWANSNTLSSFQDLSNLDYINLTSISDLPDNFFKTRIVCNAPAPRIAHENNNNLSGNRTASNQALQVSQEMLEQESQPKIIGVDKIKLYPNPTNNWLNVIVPFEWTEAKHQVQLIDVNGKSISVPIQINRNIFEINTSELSKGVYQIRFEYQFGMITKSFIKI